MKSMLYPLLLCSTLYAIPSMGFPDPIYRAFKQEIQRAQDSLRSQGGLKPYLIRGNLYRYERTTWVASQGVLERKSIDTLYSVDLDLRVGSPALDQSQFDAMDQGDHSGFAAFPPSGDPLLVRKAIWSMLDQKFKVALEVLPQKKTWLAEHPQTKVPASWIPQTPLMQNMDFAAPIGDTSPVRTKLMELSQRIEKNGDALDSRAKYEYVKTTSWYFDTENREVRQSMSENTLVAARLDQAKDGSPIWNYLRKSSPNSQDLLNLDWNLPGDKLRQRQLELKEQVALNHYRGPVLFSDDAAGSFWQGVLLDQISNVPMNNDISQNGQALVQLMGQKLLPSGLSLEINPELDSTSSFYPRFAYDQEGAKAESGLLISNGKLIKLPRRLSPYRDQPDSTIGGNYQFGGFNPSLWKISAKETMDSSAMIQYLQKLCAEEGIQEILKVRKIWDKDAYELLIHPLARNANEAAEFELFNPKTQASRAVRGLVFNPYNLKDLRSLSAFSRELTNKDNQGVQNLIYPRTMILNLDDLNPRTEIPANSLLP